MMTLKQRLEQLMTEFGWEHADLVRVSGESSSVVSQWLGKGSKEIKSIGKMEAAMRMQNATGYAALWIAKGKGLEKATIDNQSSEIPSGTVNPYSDTKTVRAPVVVWARLGTDLYKDFSEIEAFDSLPVHDNASKQVKWYVVEDDMPRFRIKRGHKVALDPYGCTPENCQEDEIYLFKTAAGRFFLAEFRALADGAFEAIPDSGLPMDSIRHKIELVAKHLGTWK